MDSSFQNREEYSLSTYPKIESNHLLSKTIYLTDNQGNRLKLNAEDFMHNGQGIGLISMRVIQENENWLLDEIEELFWQKYQIVFLNFIPLIPHDKNAKLADYLHFQDPKTLQIKNKGKNEIFWQKIANYLKKNGLRVVYSV